MISPLMCLGMNWWVSKQSKYLQGPEYNVEIEQEFKTSKLTNINSIKIGKWGILNKSCHFCYLDQHAFIEKIMTSPPKTKLLKFMTFSWQFRFPTQIQDFSGLFMTVETLVISLLPSPI